jgi:hypothetical protein
MTLRCHMATYQEVALVTFLDYIVWCVDGRSWTSLASKLYLLRTISSTDSGSKFLKDYLLRYMSTSLPFIKVRACIESGKILPAPAPYSSE